jgi:hypothetical protein
MGKTFSDEMDWREEKDGMLPRNMIMRAVSVR